ncbi:18411_t:CDS:2, partial [Entrophospora sp. SA101]
STSNNRKISNNEQSKVDSYYGSTSIEPSRQKQIDIALSVAFICCGLPFNIVENPFFVNLLKALNPGYNSPSHEVLSDGWTNPNGLNLWNFMVMTLERKEFLYCISDFSSASHTGEFLAEEINKIIECIGPKKVAAIVSDNGANIAKARRIVTSKYKHIINVRCIAHCINLISKDKHYQKLHETRWTSVHECLDSIIRLKRCLEEIHDEHSSSISNNSVISILRSRAFFKDVGYLANTLLPIKLAILEVEGR